MLFQLPGFLPKTPRGRQVFQPKTLIGSQAFYPNISKTTGSLENSDRKNFLTQIRVIELQREVDAERAGKALAVAVQVLLPPDATEVTEQDVDKTQKQKIRSLIEVHSNEDKDTIMKKVMAQHKNKLITPKNVIKIFTANSSVNSEFKK